MYQLDRILDEIELSLSEPTETLKTIIVRMVRQQQSETLAADNDQFYVGAFEDSHQDDAVVLSVFGVRCEITITVKPPFTEPIRISSRKLQHSEFIWRLKKAKAVLQRHRIELRPGPTNSASDLVSTVLALPEVAAYMRELLSLRSGKQIEPNVNEDPIEFSLPSSSEIWKALITAEEETLPEIEIAGAVEHDSNSNSLRVPYSTANGLLDFDTDDVIEVWREVDGDLRKVGELNTKETSLTTLVVEHPFRFPQKVGAVLKLRSQQDRASFVRRRSAVERIVNKESAIPNLLEYFDGAANLSPIDYGDIPIDDDLNKYDLFDGDRQVFSLNDQQRQAFRRLWTMGPVGLLQGPPGTGKTAFIASFVHYALSRGAQNILLASQSHEAVNNAAEKIVDICRQTEMPLQLVRFGAEGMVSGMIQRYHSSSLIQAYRDLARAELKSRVVSLYTNLGLPEIFVSAWFDLQFHLGRFLRQIDRLYEKQKLVPETSGEHRRYSLRIKQSSEMFASVAREKFGLQEIKDDPRSAVAELETSLMQAHHVRSPDAVARLRSVIAVAHEWIHRLGTDRANFEEFLAKTRTVVCGTCVGLGRSQLGIAKNEYDWVIVDEAARATPGELAVAIQSARRVLLVGDHRQLPPLYKSEVIDHICRTSNWKSHEYLTRSDFHRAFESSYGASVGAMLKTQYRMAPEIGELVSECFYPERLEPGRSGPPEWFSFAPERMRSIVTWIDTYGLGSEAHERQQRGSSSYENPFEAREILDLLKAIAAKEEFLQSLINYAGSDERPIGVICMYADQKRYIQKNFDEQDWSSQLRRLVKIDTVDSYQGKQNRIIILSTTRNNNSYSQGHLASAERVNVSISRAMDRLVIVGSAQMWRSPNQDRPLGRVLQFIEARKDEHKFSVIAASGRSGGAL